MGEDTVPELNGMRTWTCKDGSTLKGEFMTRMGQYILLKTDRGRQEKVQLEILSDEDLRYVSLAMPPALKIDLSKKTRQRRLKHDSNGAIGITEYRFTPRIESSDASYAHELKVDYWVVGSEIGGNRYILLEKGSNSFVPSEQPDGRFEFSGTTIDLYAWVLEHIYQQGRGERYKGFLITVTDERGVMIAHRSSPTWLFKNLNSLKKLELRSFLDDECNRVWPTPLKSTRK